MLLKEVAFDHWYVVVAGSFTTSIKPLLYPKQLILDVLIVGVKTEGSIRVYDSLLVHPWLSVIVAVYVPADKFDIFWDTLLLDHKNVNGGVPPEIFKSIAPSEFPLQLISVSYTHLTLPTILLV